MGEPVNPILYGDRGDTCQLGNRGLRQGVQTAVDHAMFTALVAIAREYRVQALRSHLSMSAAISVGARGMALAFASKDLAPGRRLENETRQ